MMSGQLPKTCGCEGWIDLEPGYSIVRMTMNDNNLVVFVEDAQDERKLVKYTLKIPEQ